MAIKITYLPPGPEAEKLRQMFKRLLFGSLRPAKRSRVHDFAIVLVQALRDAVHVPRVECPKPFVDEFDLRRIRAF